MTRFEAFIFLLLFIAFLYYTFTQSAKKENIEAIQTKPMTTGKIWALIVIGLSLLVAGGRMVVSGAENIALDFGISEKIIALTIVAAGTSLPELVTSVVAASKKNSDIAIGNVVGSNIFNILLILSISGLIHPVSYITSFNREMILLMGGTILLVMFMYIGKRHKVDRWQGAILLGVFVAYTFLLIQNEL